MRRRRLRPRFIGFVVIVGGLIWGVPMLLPHHAVRSRKPEFRPRETAGAHLKAPQASYTLTPFGLPEGLKNFSVVVQSGVVTLAGGSTGGRSLNGSVYTLTANGAVVAGSLAAPRQKGGILELTPHTVYVGGVLASNSLTSSAENLTGGAATPFLPQGLSGFATASSGGTHYLVGGNTSTGVSRVIYQVTANGQVSPWLNLPQAVSRPMAYVFSGNLYVVGGEYANHQESPTIYQIALNTKKIDRLGSLPVGVYDGAMGVAGGSLWVLGGYVHHKVSQQTWVLQGSAAVPGRPLPQALAGEATAAVGNNLWILGGRTSQGVASTIYVLKAGKP